jgi:pentafunctional AROM polypeptide
LPQLETFGRDKLAKASAFNLAPKQFWVIGYPIAQSKSPLIHNTGYRITGLPHRYSIHETPDLNDDILQMLNDQYVIACSGTPYAI